MKAAILTQLNAPLELWDLELPFRPDGKHCGPSQVLVEIFTSGICGAQLKEIEGLKGNAEFLPHCLGHEGAGIVREVGPGVNTQMIGKKVVLHWRKGAGGESIHPARYDAPNDQSVGGGHVTTLCEQAIVSANRVTVVPDDVPDELCALLGCGLSTALGTIEQEAKLKFGESILIVGCGGVGLNLIQAARLACAYPIVAMDVMSEKRAVCLNLGASEFISARTQDKNYVMRILGLKGFDCIVDTSGSIDALQATIPLLADNGRFVMIGQPKPGEDIKIMGALDMFHGEYGKRIMTTQGGGFRPSVDVPRYVNLWRAGHLDLGSIISHRMPLADINRGIDLVRAGQAGRIMIQMR